MWRGKVRRLLVAVALGAAREGGAGPGQRSGKDRRDPDARPQKGSSILQADAGRPIEDRVLQRLLFGRAQRPPRLAADHVDIADRHLPFLPAGELGGEDGSGDLQSGSLSNGRT